MAHLVTAEILANTHPLCVSTHKRREAQKKIKVFSKNTDKLKEWILLFIRRIGTMSSVSAAAQSIKTVNDVLQMTTKKSMDVAEKMMKVTVADAVGAELGKGESVDLSV
jgi:hypothetical protein